MGVPMNKHLLITTLLSIALIPFTASAISLTELQNNPDRYKAVCENKKSTIYVDNDTISSLRYYPPFYSLSADVYSVSYTNGNIIGGTFAMNYDYNQSPESIIDLIKAEHPDYTPKQISDYSAVLLFANSGIVISSSKLQVWTLDGDLTYTGDGLSNVKAQMTSPWYHATNYSFLKYYNKLFSVNISTPTEKCLY